MHPSLIKSVGRQFSLLLSLSWLCHGDAIINDNSLFNGILTEAAERQGHEEKATTEVRLSTRSNMRLDVPIVFPQSSLAMTIVRTPSGSADTNTRIASPVPFTIRV